MWRPPAAVGTTSWLKLTQRTKLSQSLSCRIMVQPHYAFSAWHAHADHCCNQHKLHPATLPKGPCTCETTKNSCRPQLQCARGQRQLQAAKGTHTALQLFVCSAQHVCSQVPVCIANPAGWQAKAWWRRQRSAAAISCAALLEAWPTTAAVAQTDMHHWYATFHCGAHCIAAHTYQQTCTVCVARRPLAATPGQEVQGMQCSWLVVPL